MQSSSVAEEGNVCFRVVMLFVSVGKKQENRSRVRRKASANDGLTERHILRRVAVRGLQYMGP